MSDLSLTIMRKILIAFAAVLTLLLICFGGFVWSLRPTIVNITDPARYSELLAAFPDSIKGHLPSSLPADAKDASLHYYCSTGGIGPGNYRLEAQFDTDAQNLASMISAARQVKDVQEEQVPITALRSFTAARGDRIGVLEVNEKTGHVSIQASIN